MQPKIQHSLKCKVMFYECIISMNEYKDSQQLHTHHVAVKVIETHEQNMFNKNKA